MSVRAELATDSCFSSSGYDMISALKASKSQCKGGTISVFDRECIVTGLYLKDSSNVSEMDEFISSIVKSRFDGLFSVQRK